MATTDGSQSDMVAELTGFQRDLMYVIADVGPANGQETKDELSDHYGKEINHGRLYPNLDTIVNKGLVDKGQIDRRTNSYELSERGKQALKNRREWEDSCLEWEDD